MLTVLPLLTAMTLAATGQLEVGIRGEGRRHWMHPSAPGQEGGTDLSAIPHLTLTVSSGTDSLELSYKPRFTWRNLGSHVSNEQFHGGELRLRQAPASRWRVESSVSGAVGRTDLVTQGPGTVAGSRTNQVVTTRSIDMRSFAVGLAVRYVPGSQADLGLALNGFTSGGATARDREVMPFDRGGDASFQLGWTTTPRDRLSLTAGGRVDNFPAHDATSTSFTTLAGWQRRSTPHLLLRGGLGAVGYVNRERATGTGGRVVKRAVGPAAEAGLSTEAELPGALDRVKTHQVLEIDLQGRLGAFDDRGTGVEAPGLQGIGTLRWSPTSALGLRARGTGFVIWPERGLVRGAGADLALAFRAASWAPMDLGVYGVWQTSSSPTTPTFSEYGVVVGFGADAPPLTF
jgi:hypothetical protein